MKDRIEEAQQTVVRLEARIRAQESQQTLFGDEELRDEIVQKLVRDLQKAQRQLHRLEMEFHKRAIAERGWTQ